MSKYCNYYKTVLSKCISVFIILESNKFQVLSNISFKMG